MSRIFLSVADEDRLLAEVQQRQTRLRARTSAVTPVQGQLAGQYGDAYPWMDPSVVGSLVQFGVPADSPQAQSTASLAAQQANDTGEFQTPGEDLADPWYEQLSDTLLGWAKPVVRTGFTVLATPIEEIQALLTSLGEASQSDPKAEGGWSLSEVIADLPELGEDLNRFWHNYTDKAARSGGMLALGDLLAGKHVDLGQGWLPGGEIWEEREQAKQRLQLDGQFLTPGRLIARDIVEPGGTAHQVTSGLFDAGLQLFGDPSVIATGGLSKAAQASRSFRALGTLNGLRRTVAPEVAVNHYLTSNTGRRLVRWLTENNDVDSVWKATGEADLGLAEALARTRSDTETAGLLREALGTTVREKPTAGFVGQAVGSVVGAATGNARYGALFGGGAAVKRSVSNARFLSEMPGQALNSHNINQSAKDLDRWMRNAGIAEDVRKGHIGTLATVKDGDAVGLYNVARQVMRDTETRLVQDFGVLRSRAQKLTQMYEVVADDVVAFGFDDLGRHQDVLAPFRVKMGNEVVTDPKGAPLMLSELISDTVPLPPHARDIRRATAQAFGMDSKTLSKLYQSKGWKVPVDGLDWVMSNVWKPFQLLRGAYTFRVIAEEQMRMAGAGYDSLISNPVSAIAWSLSVDPKSRLGRALAKPFSAALDPKGTRTVTGEMWDDVAEHAAAMSRGAAGHAGLPGEIATGRFVRADRDTDPDFWRGWTVELSHMSNDPVMRRLAGGLSEGDMSSVRAGWEGTGDTVRDVKEWFWSGNGQKFRKELGKVEGRSKLLTEPSVADEYIDMYVDRLRNSTGQNADLVDAVANGRLNGLNLRGFGDEGKMARSLEESYFDAAPRFVKKQETVRARGQSSQWRRVIDLGFDALMSKPTNWLSRSPTFRQKYWERVEELVGSSTRETQEAIIRNARKANLGKEAETRMAGSVLRTDDTAAQLSSLSEVDYLAKSYALDETRKLLYDLNKRGQFMDQARLIFPFGEAWKEIIGAWTGIIRKNPQVLRRFQQGIQGARASSVLPGATPGLTRPPGSEMTEEEAEAQGYGRGFFHTDPTTGEEVFTYPAAWAGKLLSVLPGRLGDAGEALANPDTGVSLVGRAAGLNIVSATVLPGFGPAVQYPASKIIPQTPNYDDLREVLLPFGGPQGDNVIEEAADMVLPAWMDKVLTSWEDPQKHRLFANTVADVQRALLARGKHDISTVEGQQALYDEAVSAARGLFLIRGIAQSTVPTGPSFQWNTTDVEGNVVPVKVLSDEYRRLAQDEYGGDWDMAFTEWVRRFGVNNVLALIGKSHAIKERPVTEAGDDWLRAHEGLEREFDLTIGLFAPEPAEGEFDYSAYLRQFETQAREMTTPAEQIALANDLLGRVQFEQVKQVASFRPSPTTNLWVAQMRDRIAEMYPGFDGWVAESQWAKRPTSDQLINELRRAVSNPTLARTDAGRGIAKYLSAVEVAKGMVTQLPGNVKHYQQAKTAAPIRFWLRSVARSIIEEHPDFSRAWSNVFERELAEDDVMGGVAA